MYIPIPVLPKPPFFDKPSVCDLPVDPSDDRGRLVVEFRDGFLEVLWQGLPDIFSLLSRRLLGWFVWLDRPDAPIQLEFDGLNLGGEPNGHSIFNAIVLFFDLL